MGFRDSMVVDRPKLVCAGAAFAGSIVLLVAVYLFINRIVFLTHAT